MAIPSEQPSPSPWAGQPAGLLAARIIRGLRALRGWAVDVLEIVRGHRGRWWQALAILVLVLLALRLLLPYVLLSLINRELDKPGSIHGHVGSLSLGIMRGVYDIGDVHLTAHNADTGAQDRLLDIDHLEVDTSWRALLAGRLEGDVALRGVVLHLGAPAKKVAKEKARPWTEDNWRTVIGRLVRVRIAAVAVSQGQITYDDAVRGIHASCSTIEGRLEDLIVPTGAHRPARFTFTGMTPGEGFLQIVGTARAEKDKPELQLKAALERVDLPALSPITRHYDGLIFTSGSFSGYLDIALDGSHLHGTFKPLFHRLEVASLRTKSGSAATALFWSLVVPVATYALRNTDRDQHAAIVPIDGRIDDPHTDLWTIATTALGNAFITALIPGFTDLKP